ncbi:MULTISPECIES: hypothetical protein [Roseobacteraceae]|uniref:hypothetical protein n=1 Tax=Roseobacteraceae TaxID=2854170 RepID=UPI0013DB5629|nr:hypothetical protein [Salipiger sp. PrR003]NDV53371.1 hypothetical protein [Salipiger sp. PrR003]
MDNAVSLSDVLADYISRYGLTEKARLYFLEHVDPKTSPEGRERVDARQEPGPK